MGYIIPSNEITLTDEKRSRDVTLEQLITLGVKSLSTPRSRLVARGAQNIADFGTILDQWNTAALLVLGTFYTIFQAIAAPRLAVTSVIGFYKVAVETAPSPVALMRFQEGAAGGTTFDFFDLEQFVGKLEAEGYFSGPIIYDKNQVLNITVSARVATGLLARVQPGNILVEPVGAVVS